MSSEINVPFRVDGNGRVVTASNPDAQIRLHVLALLNTIPEERAMVPGTVPTSSRWCSVTLTGTRWLLRHP